MQRPRNSFTLIAALVGVTLLGSFVGYHFFPSRQNTNSQIGLTQNSENKNKFTIFTTTTQGGNLVCDSDGCSIGTSGDPIDNGYFTNLTATTLVVSSAATGPLSVGGGATTTITGDGTTSTFRSPVTIATTTAEALLITKANDGGDILSVDSASGTIVHTISDLGTGKVGITYNFTTANVGSAAGPGGLLLNLNSGYTGVNFTYGLSFDNNVAGTSATYSTDATYGARLSGNRGAGGHARGITTGHNVAGLFTASRGNVNWGSWNGATVDKSNASNIGSIGLGYNDGSGGEGIGIYALYQNPSAIPTIPADLRTALFANSTSSTADIATFADNGTEVFSVSKPGYIAHTPSAITSGNSTYFLFTGPTDTGLTASTEQNGWVWANSTNKTWNAGHLATQREYYIGNPTYTISGGSSIIDTAATFAVAAAPIAGTSTILKQAFAAQFGGTVNIGAAASNTIYAAINVPDHAVTLTGSTQVTSTGSAGIRIGQITYVDSSSLTMDLLSSLYIKDAPATGGSAIGTNKYAIFVDGGLSRFDGGIDMNTSTIVGVSALSGVASTTFITSIPTSTAGAGADYIIAAGSTDASNQNGGNLMLSPGKPNGNGRPGTVQIYATSASNYVGSFGSTGSSVFSVYGINGTTAIDFALAAQTPAIGFKIGFISSGVNYLQANGAITGKSPGLYATGTDSNINLDLVPKGTGYVSTTAGILLGSGQSVFTQYVSGTFTPTVSDGGVGTVPQYTTNTGRYTRIGNRVQMDVYLAGDGGNEGAGAGQLTIALPIAASASQPDSVFPCGWAQNMAANDILLCEIEAGGSVVSLWYQAIITTTNNFTAADQNNATRSIRINLNYEVNS